MIVEQMVRSRSFTRSYKIAPGKSMAFRHVAWHILSCANSNSVFSPPSPTPQHQRRQSRFESEWIALERKRENLAPASGFHTLSQSSADIGLPRSSPRAAWSQRRVLPQSLENHLESPVFPGRISLVSATGEVRPSDRPNRPTDRKFVHTISIGIGVVDQPFR